MTASSGRLELMRALTCPACAHHVAVPFFEGGADRLATLAWPAGAAEAQALDRLPLDFVCCVAAPKRARGGGGDSRRGDRSAVARPDRPACRRADRS